MSNVPSLTSYLLADRWRDELNVDNPLGMHGQIATTYAQLIQDKGSPADTAAYRAPRSFKARRFEYHYISLSVCVCVLLCMCLCVCLAVCVSVCVSCCVCVYILLYGL